MFIITVVNIFVKMSNTNNNNEPRMRPNYALLITQLTKKPGPVIKPIARLIVHEPITRLIVPEPIVRQSMRGSENKRQFPGFSKCEIENIEFLGFEEVGNELIEKLIKLIRTKRGRKLINSPSWDLIRCKLPAQYLSEDKQEHLGGFSKCEIENIEFLGFDEIDDKLIEKLIKLIKTKDGRDIINSPGWDSIRCKLPAQYLFACQV